ncbi:hypothetical protein ART_3173 [Arthrobacter sp. PAMC 25486]|nr:hypothetical protein ART_3173 [Arthrobacter sp. PAMC 25486]
MRIESYLIRLEWHLEGILRGADRKATITSLRQELLTDPRELASALADLGPASVLAARYGDEGERRPLWSMGVVIGAIALLAYWAVFLSFTGGMLAAVDSAAPAEAHSTFLFVGVEAFSNAESIGIGWVSGWAWLVVPATIVLAAFLLGARIWRAFRRQ